MLALQKTFEPVVSILLPLHVMHSFCSEQKRWSPQPGGQDGPDLLGPRSHSPETSSLLNVRHAFLARDPDFPPAESPKLEEAISHGPSLCPREYRKRFHKAKGLLQEASKSSCCETQPGGRCPSAGLSSRKTHFGPRIPHVTGKSFQHSASSSGSFPETCLM